MKSTQPTHAITKSHVECYKIRRIGTHGGWADITLDVNGNAGRIQIASDYGSWEHYWGSCGCPFKEFLVELSNDIHYAAGKFGEGKWFDQEATMADLRREVDGCDEDDEVKDQMRQELDLYLEDCMEVNSWVTQAYNCDVLRKLWDSGPSIQYDVSPLFRKFWEKVWPVFVDELKKEIES